MLTTTKRLSLLVILSKWWPTFLIILMLPPVRKNKKAMVNLEVVWCWNLKIKILICPLSITLVGKLEIQAIEILSMSVQLIKPKLWSSKFQKSLPLPTIMIKIKTAKQKIKHLLSLDFFMEGADLSVQILFRVVIWVIILLMARVETIEVWFLNQNLQQDITTIFLLPISYQLRHTAKDRELILTWLGEEMPVIIEYLIKIQI